MTELEQHLLTAFEALSAQYSDDVQSLSQQISALSQRLDELTSSLNLRLAASETQFRTLSKMLNDFSAELEKL